MAPGPWYTTPCDDEVRVRDGRDPQPSAAVLDSQSAKSSEGGEAIGYDAGKRSGPASAICS